MLTVVASWVIFRNDKATEAYSLLKRLNCIGILKNLEKDHNQKQAEVSGPHKRFGVFDPRACYVMTGNKVVKGFPPNVPFAIWNIHDEVKLKIIRKPVLVFNINLSEVRTHRSYQSSTREFQPNAIHRANSQ